MDRLLDVGTKETVLHASLPLLVEALEWIAAGIDLFAILLLVIGALRFMAGFIRAELRRDSGQRLRTSNRARLELGKEGGGAGGGKSFILQPWTSKSAFWFKMAFRGLG